MIIFLRLLALTVIGFIGVSLVGAPYIPASADMNVINSGFLVAGAVWGIICELCWQKGGVMKDWEEISKDERAKILAKAGCTQDQVNAWIECDYSHVQKMMGDVQRDYIVGKNLRFVTRLALIASAFILILWSFGNV